jgi:lipid II:glycine glycyltransferase (peptidoglycan interpeptide bridge formation enzyme)
MTDLTAAQWDNFLASYPDAHLLQTTAWGELKAAFGWSVLRLAEGDAGAQVLFRSLPFGFTLAYIPKGPLGCPDDSRAQSALWQAVDDACRPRKAIFLKVEPDIWERQDASDYPEQERPSLAPPRGFRLGFQSIQPQRTLLVDLSGDEERILSRMKQKTRYNIRLAQKKGVLVRPSADLETFHRLMVVTGGRDAFGVHSLAYYRRAYELFYPRGECELLLAEYQGEPLAALMVFAHGRRAWYLYFSSYNAHRERMPTYLLQWEAMRWARERGCEAYDLWGVPDADEASLEASFEKLTGGLWGVYRFKRGFGGVLSRAAGPWDRIYRPWLYALYRLWALRRTRVE